MRNDVAYWAERVIGRPFTPPDISRMVLRYRLTMVLCWSISFLIAAVVTWLILYRQQAPATIKLAFLDYPGHTITPIEKQTEPASLKQDLPALKLAPSKPSDFKDADPGAPDTQKRDQTRPVERKQEPAKVTKPSQVVLVTPSTQKSEQPGKAVEMNLHLQPDMARLGNEKDKPVDIAPAEKLGISQIQSDSLTLKNGSKVNLGGRLPNGEIVKHIDPTKGMVETDRRVLMVLP